MVSSTLAVVTMWIHVHSSYPLQFFSVNHLACWATIICMLCSSEYLISVVLTDIETRDEVNNTPVNIAARLGHDRWVYTTMYNNIIIIIVVIFICYYNMWEGGPRKRNNLYCIIL